MSVRINVRRYYMYVCTYMQYCANVCTIVLVLCVIQHEHLCTYVCAILYTGLVRGCQGISCNVDKVCMYFTNHL